MTHKIKAHQLNYIYSVLSEKLNDYICKGWYSYEDDMIELHLCMAELIALEMDVRKSEAQENESK